MGPTLSVRRGQKASRSLVISSVAGTLLGLVFALLLRESPNYALGSLVLLALLVALGRSEWVPLGQLRGPAGRSLRLPILEQAIGYLLCLLWLSPPSLMALCVGFFLYRLLDVYPIGLVRRLRQAGSRDRLLVGQLVTGCLALGCMTVLRLGLLSELWSAAR